MTGIAWEDEDSADVAARSRVSRAVRLLLRRRGRRRPHDHGHEGQHRGLDDPADQQRLRAHDPHDQEAVGRRAAGTWPIARATAPTTNSIRVDGPRRGRVVLGRRVPGWSNSPAQRADRRGAGRRVVYSCANVAPAGGTSTVSLFPVTVTDGPPARSPLDRRPNTYGSAPVDPLQPTCATRAASPGADAASRLAEPTPAPPLPIPAPQPTLPYGAPDPPAGPDLVPARARRPAADLVVTHTLAPRTDPARPDRRPSPASATPARGRRRCRRARLPQYPNRRRGARRAGPRRSHRGRSLPHAAARALRARHAPAETTVEIRATRRPLGGRAAQTSCSRRARRPRGNTTNNHAGRRLHAGAGRRRCACASARRRRARRSGV